MGIAVVCTGGKLLVCHGEHRATATRCKGRAHQLPVGPELATARADLIMSAGRYQDRLISREQQQHHKQVQLFL